MQSNLNDTELIGDYVNLRTIWEIAASGVRRRRTDAIPTRDLWVFLCIGWFWKCSLVRIRMSLEFGGVDWKMVHALMHFG